MSGLPGLTKLKGQIWPEAVLKKAKYSNMKKGLIKAKFFTRFKVRIS